MTIIFDTLHTVLSSLTCPRAAYFASYFFQTFLVVTLRAMYFNVILALLPAALATPLALELEQRAASPLCPAVKSIVTKLKQQSAATAFCSSYLHIRFWCACRLIAISMT